MSARLRRFVAVAAVAVTALTVAPAAAFGHKPGHAETPRPTSPVPGFVLDRGRYTSIQVPGATGESLAGGINNRGQIVGQYRDARGEHGYLSHAQGKLTTIDIPGALATAPVKINDRGQIVGIYSRNATNTKDPDATVHGFVLHRGKVTTIDYPGAASTQAAGINNRGEVVGDYFETAGAAHGFRWYEGRFTRIDVPGTFTGVLDINDRGRTVPRLRARKGQVHVVRRPGSPVHVRLRHRQPWPDRGFHRHGRRGDRAPRLPRRQARPGYLRADRLLRRAQHRRHRHQRLGPDRRLLREPRRRHRPAGQPSLE